ncbi:hypothetical protein N9901_01250 [Flavobacteriaceae bacterium]|nr:hypothetical protein [Flavobacteriaceae bacterium]
MENAILITRILAICYWAFALGILLNGAYYKIVLSSIINNSTTLFYGGFIATVLGLLILHNNSNWDNNSTSIITLVGWIATIKGILLLVFPKQISRYSNKLLKPKNLNKIILPIALIASVVFSYFGFIY